MGYESGGIYRILFNGTTVAACSEVTFDESIDSKPRMGADGAANGADSGAAGQQSDDDDDDDNCDSAAGNGAPPAAGGGVPPGSSAPDVEMEDVNNPRYPVRERKRPGEW